MQLFVNILIHSSIILLIGQSFSMVYISTKNFNIAQAITITISGYFTHFFFHQLNFSLCFAIPLAIILSILLGLLFEILIYKPLRKKSTSPLLMLIVSLGIYVVLQNVISLIWGDDTKNFNLSQVKIGNEFLGAYVSDIQIISIAISLALFIASLLILKYSKIGQNIRAISANEELAGIMGLNSNTIILYTFGIGSGLAAIVGIIVGLDIGLTPTMGFNLLLYGVVAMIIGGVDSSWGLIGGALLIATAQHLTAYYIDSKWLDAITYAILILFLIWKPLGFSGRRLKKTEV